MGAGRGGEKEQDQEDQEDQEEKAEEEEDQQHEERETRDWSDSINWILSERSLVTIDWTIPSRGANSEDDDDFGELPPPIRPKGVLLMEMVDTEDYQTICSSITAPPSDRASTHPRH
eukprot:752135-Hanusia_phi.AAC.1